MSFPPPKKSRLGLVLGLLLAVTVIGVFVYGVSSISSTHTYSPATERGRAIQDYAEDVPDTSEGALAKLEDEMRVSREMYPEVVSYEKLLAGRAEDSNGWEFLTDGGKAVEPMFKNEHKSASELAEYSIALNEDREADLNAATAYMLATNSMPNYLRQCTSAESIFPLLHIRDDGTGTVTTPYLNEYLDICASRVAVLFAQDMSPLAVVELMPLVELCSRCHDDRNRATAEWWNAFRNRVLKVCVLQPLNAGKLSVTETKRIVEYRWTTDPNDRNIWLNNLADVMSRYQWAIDNDSTRLLPGRDGVQSFKQLSPWDLNAYAFHVKTARDHVEDSDNNTLDMSDDGYLADYLKDYADNELLDMADG
ncbi:MAG: hypothetical protein ACYTDT_07825 [Planctomycetota bacterium]|jgi:hypothetical protein